MIKKLLFIALLFLGLNEATAQQINNGDEPYFINVFIGADKTIYVETDKTSFGEVKTKVANIIRKKPFNLDQRIVYRIFADENLKHHYIMDVNSEMISGYGDNVRTLKYLLDTVEFNIDGQNWFDSKEIQKLKFDQN